MSIKQLDHLNMTVKDLEQSIEWYVRIFGFEEVERGNRDGTDWAIIKSGEAMLCIYQHPDRIGPQRFLKDNANRHAIYHFGFRITDKDAWLKIVNENDLELEFGGEVDYLHSKSWYVSDPSGYSIEVVHWSQDQIAFG
jgi:lactoylglutathione lyase